jgi:chemosensory pili system protein ChpA (sensor histidine kinase/response regulator)
MTLKDDEEEALLKIFLEEAKDLLDAISAALQSWATDLTQHESVLDLKRDLHTLKGGARMIGQPSLSALAHELESFCDLHLSGHFPDSKAAYDLICLAYDRMSVMVEALLKRGSLPGIDDLLEKLKNPESAADKKIVEKNSENFEDKAKTESAPEVIRIKSELLEKLNNLSIENNIVRVNLGHHVDKLKMNLNESIRLIRSLHEKLSVHFKEEELRVTSEVLGLSEIHKTLTQNYTNVEALLSQQSRISLELQERLIDTRMVSFASIIPRLSRISRQVAAELNKEINFTVVQAEGEVDRNLIDHVVPSLEHLLRNAIDHGIEPEARRSILNKPLVGKISIRFFRMGNDACMEISDDGSGINLEAVRRKAIKLGLLSEETVCSDEEIIRFIFEPGFSTRDEVSEISGRGVGMDVVNTVIKALGGNLSIETNFGQGTRFTIRLPFTTSMNRALLVTVQSQTFGILLSNVASIVLLSVKQIKEALNKQQPVVYNKKEYNLKYLGGVLGIQERPLIANTKESLPVLFFNFVDYNAALLVDSLAGSQEVVVQTLGPQFKLMDVFSGATLLADGRVLVILDAYSITARTRRKMEETVEQNRIIKKQPIVLVVDDSITIRTVTKNFLERHKYTIMTAKDGLDALGKVEEQMPDIILLDLEMPRMDGFEFAEKFRSNPKFARIPIVMITFCTGDEEKKRAKELGVEKFINKPYREPELLETLDLLLDRDK